jgi:hypothetical protein
LLTLAPAALPAAPAATACLLLLPARLARQRIVGQVPNPWWPTTTRPIASAVRPSFPMPRPWRRHPVWWHVMWGAVRTPLPARAVPRLPSLPLCCCCLCLLPVGIAAVWRAVIIPRPPFPLPAPLVLWLPVILPPAPATALTLALPVAVRHGSSVVRARATRRAVPARGETPTRTPSIPVTTRRPALPVRRAPRAPIRPWAAVCWPATTPAADATRAATLLLPRRCAMPLRWPRWTLRPVMPPVSRVRPRPSM